MILPTPPVNLVDRKVLRQRLRLGLVLLTYTRVISGNLLRRQINIMVLGLFTSAARFVSGKVAELDRVQSAGREVAGLVFHIRDQATVRAVDQLVHADDRARLGPGVGIFGTPLSFTGCSS